MYLHNLIIPRLMLLYVLASHGPIANKPGVTTPLESSFTSNQTTTTATATATVTATAITQEASVRNTLIDQIVRASNVPINLRTYHNIFFL